MKNTLLELSAVSSLVFYKDYDGVCWNCINTNSNSFGKSIEVANYQKLDFVSPIIKSHNLFVVIIDAKVRIVIPEKVHNRFYD